VATRRFLRANPIGSELQLEFTHGDSHSLSVAIPRENAWKLAEEVIAALRRTEVRYPGIHPAQENAARR
jgi:hypothetical protein